MSTFRDATYSAEVQAALRELRSFLVSEPDPLNLRTRYVEALDDVIGRWDTNEALSPERRDHNGWTRAEWTHEDDVDWPTA